MAPRFYIALLLCLSLVAGAQGQNDVRLKAFAVTVTPLPGARGLRLSWPATPTQQVVNKVYREGPAGELKYMGQTRPAALFFDDSTARQDSAISYMIQRRNPGYPDVWASRTRAARMLPAVHQRGHIIVVVERGLAQALATELAAYERDLHADGWLSSRILVGELDAPHAVRARIRAAAQRYTALPETHAFLLGRVPVPYAGDIFPDGHTDHEGAWPADGYYTHLANDADTRWTDERINVNTAARADNRNIPGDGKFDQSAIPGTPAIGVARIRFDKLPVFLGIDSGQTETFLTRRYLAKLRHYKSGAYKVLGNTFTEDNFGYHSGEAFAASGWANGYNLFGLDSCHWGYYYNSPRYINFALGYGCGPGQYTAAQNVLESYNIARDSLNVIFNMLFGSYFGDWDSPDNLMRSLLAGRSMALTCSWSGRPYHWYNNLGLGGSYGACARLNHAVCGTIATAMLGEPSLRIFYPPAIARLVAVPDSQGRIHLHWPAVADTAVHGYHIYRAATDTSAFALVRTAPVADTAFTDTTPATGRHVYMVRAVRTERTVSGAYANLGLGAMSLSVQARLPTVNLRTLAAALSLYPNPTTGMLHPTTPWPAGTAVDVFSTDGACVLHASPTGLEPLHLHVLPGLYQVVNSWPGGRASARVVVE